MTIRPGRSIAFDTPHGVCNISGPVKLAVVISQFPCSDEVFILRELRALQKRGIDMRIYSIKQPARSSFNFDIVAYIGPLKYRRLLLNIRRHYRGNFLYDSQLCGNTTIGCRFNIFR